MKATTVASRSRTTETPRHRDPFLSWAYESGRPARLGTHRRIVGRASQRRTHRRTVALSGAPSHLAPSDAPSHRRTVAPVASHSPTTRNISQHSTAPTPVIENPQARSLLKVGRTASGAVIPARHMAPTVESGDTST